MLSMKGRMASMRRALKARPTRSFSRWWSSPSEVSMLTTSTQTVSQAMANGR